MQRLHTRFRIIYKMCLFVCPVCNIIIGEYKTIENVVYLFICDAYQESEQF